MESLPKPKRWGGVLDLAVFGLTAWVLITGTPVGGLMVRGWAWALDRPPPRRDLASYFDIRSNQDQQLAAQILTPASDVTRDEAIKIGLPPELSRAVTVLLAEGRASGDSLDVQLSPAAQAELLAYGLTWPADAAGRNQVTLELLSRLSTELGGLEPAVAALAVGKRPVQYAMSLADSARVRNPKQLEGFGEYLRGDLRSLATPLVNGSFALATAYNLVWPVAQDARVSSAFGERVHPTTGKKHLHSGVDLAVPSGTPVVAAAAGKVRYATEDTINGKFVKLEHGYGLQTAYCHASEIEVKKGDAVAQGQRVMASGATGRVSGPHLHFQLELDGQLLDPELFRPRS